MGTSPPPVVDDLERLAEPLGTLGARRVLVLCSPSRRFVPQVVQALASFDPTVFDAARVHVPSEVVDAAKRVLSDKRADALVALGGGSVIGLAKALRLAHDVRFVAIPTTYSGSEMTSIWGITESGKKTTGRDPRVLPDLVVYDQRLFAALPIGVTVKSLLNALAHPISALSTHSLAGDHRAEALATAAALLRAIEDLLLAPTDPAARRTALAAASAAGVLLDRGKAGAQHAIAHFVGGALGLDHAALHAVLLPGFVAHLREQDAVLVSELERAMGTRDLESHLHDLLVRAGLPTSLVALGAKVDAIQKLIDARPDLPAAIIEDARHGLRPTGAAGRIAVGPAPLALLAGPRPERARRAVVALHGRNAEAGGIVRRFVEIAGHDPETSIIGLRNDGDRWYDVRYGQAGAGADPEVLSALERVKASLADLARAIAPSSTVLAGFSQGACLALEYAARDGAGLAAVIAPCGARIGLPSEWERPPSINRWAGVQVLLGAGAHDPWMDAERIDRTAEWFRGAGAMVDILGHPGDRHDISPRQRLRAREMLRGARTPPGATGFGNTIESEAVSGALPRRQNSPRVPPFGLYAEQLNGSGFTAQRADNVRTWCYRARPSSQRRDFAPLDHPRFTTGFEGRPLAINLTGLPPLPLPADPRDFLDGLVTVAGAGHPSIRRGCAVHLYGCNRDMDRRAFYDADGDLLFLPELGALTLMTELGCLEVAPGQIAVIPRGVTFSVLLHGPLARGYVGETYGRHFRLPERGPIGANSLADPRHFRAPSAWYEDRLAPDFRVVAKLGGRLYEASQDHSPFDVVAWHGNYFPYVYDLADFSPVGSVRFDHPDPSLYTVLTAPLDEPGAHTLDLVVFAPRWDVTTGTFRPPFFHRNPVSEVNGIVRESAPPTSPFQPGCCFITPPLAGHGPSGRTVERIRALGDAEADAPAPPGDGLWFQFECALPLSLTPWAEEAQIGDWAATWGSHRSYFDPRQQ